MGKIQLKKLDIGVLGNIPSMFLEGGLEQAANKYLAKGIQLPIIEGYTLNNTVINFADRTIQIGSDLVKT